jgi:pantoate--beta-alanine ligase
VIRELVRQTGSKVRIIGCPIIREEDGLAMSSRNTLLENEIRNNAGVIYKTISVASEMIKDNDVPEIENYVSTTIGKVKGFSVEYFNIVDDRELRPVASRSEMKKGSKYFGCIAVRAGKIRLIDNIEFPL